MDAIFIQSFDKEIKNEKLQRLINRIFKNLKQKNTKIVIFLNYSSMSIFKKVLIPSEMDVEVVYVEEDACLNPTTRIFHFLINYKVQEFRKILLLESDCFLINDFDEKLNDFEKNQKKWLIIGSTYYGLMPWMNDKDYFESRKNHMNGVAIYNRTNDFIEFINYIFISHEIEESSTNYDYALHIHSLSYGLNDSYVDCPLILNISDPRYDTDLTHHKIKPNAVIVHTKNEKYYI
jgi:hypothetical protein